MLGAPAAALLIWSDQSRTLNFLGLVLLGFSLAPIYPLLIAETPKRLGAAHAANAIGFQVSAAYIGTATIPGLTGILAQGSGLEIVGPVLFSTAAVLLVLHEVSLRGFGNV